MVACPPWIKALIELANLLGGQQLPHIGDVLLQHVGEGGDPWASAAQVATGLPRAFHDYVGPIGSDTRPAFVPRWDSVYRAWQTLVAVTTVSRGKADLGRAFGPQAVWLQQDAKGGLEIHLAPEIRALSGVEARRVAQCVQCGKFIWMERLRPRPLCSNACRQADWRIRNPEKYRAIQIENERRRSAKELKERTPRSAASGNGIRRSQSQGRIKRRQRPQ
jgi:hypothetical protein